MQKNTKRLLAPFLLLGFLFVSSSPSAAALTAGQMEAISALMRSFGADEAVVKNVQMSLDGSMVSKAAQGATRTAVQANKKPVSQSQVFDGDIDPEGPVSSCVALTTNLRYRSRDAQTGGQVSLLQDFLQSRGFLNSEPTGYFGLLSLKAVKQFQKSVGIEPTGFVGVLTRAKIKEISCGNIVPLPAPEKYGCYPEFAGGPIVCVDPPAPRPSGLEVISPNGGETWQKGTTQLIRWVKISVSTSPGSQDEVILPANISLTSYTPPCVTTSSNTGKSEVCPAMPTAIYLIASNAPNSGEYRWVVGATTHSDTTIPDGAYVMRVCAGSVCDQSNSYFKIVSQGANLPPVIDGVSGPTVLNVGQLGTWSVRAHDPENGPLSYIVNWGDDVSSGSAGVGTSPMSISASQTTTFTHNYSRPGAYKISFTVTDSKGLTAQSTISVNVGAVQNSPPKIIGFPGIPTNIQPGQTVNFSWSATDADNDDLSWSVDFGDSGGGSSCSVIRRQTGTGWSHNTSHAWTQSGTYQVKATVSDCVGGGDSSSFTITVGTTQPSITVLSPNGGETWQKGTTQTIKWQDRTPPPPCAVRSDGTGSEGCFIHYDLTLVPYITPCPSGAVCILSDPAPYTIAKGVDGTSYSWGVGKVVDVGRIIPDGSYTVQVCQTGTSTCDSSHSSFTITAPISKPLVCGALGDVNADGVISNADIELMRPAILGSTTLTEAQRRAADVSGDGAVTTLDITLINAYLVGTKTTFPACGTLPSITLTSPVAGETITTQTINGKTANFLTFRWTTKNWPDTLNLKFELVKSDGTILPIVASPMEPYVGSYPINVSASVNGTYKARVYAVKEGPLSATEEAWSGYFTIAIPPPTPSITVISPNRGENWQKGTTQAIRWYSTVGDSVNISLSNYLSCWESEPACGAPAVLYPLANAIPFVATTSGSSYNWTVGKAQNGSDIPSGQYKVTVSSATSPSVSDQSNSAFTITPPPLTDQEIITGLTNVVRRNQCSPLTLASCNPNFDFNNDVLVNVTDVAIMTGVLTQSDSVFDTVYKKTKAAITERFGQRTGDAKFIPEFDVDKNGVIDQNDWERISKALIGIRVYPPPTTTSLNPETVNALAEFSQKKNLNLASILAAIAQLIEAFK